MKRSRTLRVGLLILTAALAMGPAGCRNEALEEKATALPSDSDPVDKRSFDLGMIQDFSEMVTAGVKSAALSPPLDPEEVDRLITKAEEIARDNGVHLYRENDFITTDLFPAELTEGKHVLLIYADLEVRETYMALKAKKEALISAGEYEGEERKEIARGIGRLLSYREDQIEKRLLK